MPRARPRCAAVRARRGACPRVARAPAPPARERHPPAAAQAIVLFTSPWMPLLAGELRLFSGGLAFTTERHGPHLLPFRIHLAAAAAVDMDCSRGPGLVLLRQKPDSVGYGPLSLLPPTIGGALPSAELPPERSLAIAIVLPPRSGLQKVMASHVWPIWRQCFTECGVPCDTLSAPPAEFDGALAALRLHDEGHASPPPGFAC